MAEQVADEHLWQIGWESVWVRPLGTEAGQTPVAVSERGGDLRQLVETGFVIEVLSDCVDVVSKILSRRRERIDVEPCGGEVPPGEVDELRQPGGILCDACERGAQLRRASHEDGGDVDRHRNTSTQPSSRRAVNREESNPASEIWMPAFATAARVSLSTFVSTGSVPRSSASALVALRYQ